MAAPTPDLSYFLSRYPEFGAAATDFPALVSTALAEAAAETSDWTFPTAVAQRDYAMLKAAVLLYHSPYAREMRLDGAGAEKIQGLERLLQARGRSSTMGLRVF
jgi:hypothetical protein